MEHAVYYDPRCDEIFLGDLRDNIPHLRRSDTGDISYDYEYIFDKENLIYIGEL